MTGKMKKTIIIRFMNIDGQEVAIVSVRYDEQCDALALYVDDGTSKTMEVFMRKHEAEELIRALDQAAGSEAAVEKTVVRFTDLDTSEPAHASIGYGEQDVYLGLFIDTPRGNDIELTMAKEDAKELIEGFRNAIWHPDKPLHTMETFLPGDPMPEDMIKELDLPPNARWPDLSRPAHSRLGSLWDSVVRWWRTRFGRRT